MKTRIKIDQAEPAGYQAILGLEKFIESTPLTRTHKDLIKIRASQINGCAFCIDMHTEEARKASETEQRIYALNAWRDTPFFTTEERAILALTEEVTLISGHVKDETYQAASEVLDKTYLAQVILAIITINAWNRIGITTQLVPA
ncbi:carboxymuconolactone decarboxylase family protein [Flavobacterium sp. MMLR14_040]|jgi:AhpD family alkylhydroperoxidase|uniref:carboxymuconolactone decarboxylase family protein n=1 Tax=Flavobacterium sp. MMLR14_040 TaxID=3093843 RepID=UPI00298F6D96|nr:carboxymuconolactone decarboxylase family protein [Flavobacterium sp. MMLR14_040]MDW8848957.1 carboxymuconolactone decarboxylase family protein [Flavobacterium sp. MMLR14_040]